MRSLATIIGLVFVAACAVPVGTPAAWEATLEGRPGFAGVSGTSTATSIAGQTAVTASIAGATAGATHPWHIHLGDCANDEGILGAAEAYPPLQPGPDGRATAAATVNVPLEPRQPYFVNVHASPEDLETIVACGELMRP